MILSSHVSGTSPQITGDASPARIPGLVAWYDAAYLNLADGDPVGTFPDLSGNGSDMTRDTTSQKPIFVANFNGAPAVYFDGVDDYMQDELDSNLMGVPPFTEVINFYNDPAVGSGVFSKFQQLVAPFKVWEFKEASGKLQISLEDSSSVLHTATGSTVMSAGETSIAMTISAGLVQNAYLNAVLDATQTLSSVLAPNGRLRLSHSGAGMNKNIRNIMFYDRVLTVSELEYLKNV